MAKKQLVGEEINKARAILELHPLQPQHDESLQARGAEAELEADHPVVASVISGVIRTLANMGI